MNGLPGIGQAQVTGPRWCKNVFGRFSVMSVSSEFNVDSIAWVLKWVYFKSAVEEPIRDEASIRYIRYSLNDFLMRLHIRRR